MGKQKDNPVDLSKLSKKEIIGNAKKLSKQYRIDNGKKFNLKNFDSNSSSATGATDKPLAKDTLQLGVQALAAMQNILYAQDRWSVLLIFQAMDAAGKDGAIKHVMSGVNPQGCHVTSYKAPSEEELDHDFMWRCMKNLPERGRIGIFNRSYYEEVLIVRVHEELLRSQKIPVKLITKNIWEDRFEDIRHFEKYLDRNGTVVIKFFLHVSKQEQKKRFLERIDNPEKNWKFNAGDVRERMHWKEYMNAYEDMIKNTSTEKSPWYVVPADNKAFARMIISSAVISTLSKLDLEYPTLDKEQITQLAKTKAELIAEK